MFQLSKRFDTRYAFWKSWKSTKRRKWQEYTASSLLQLQQNDNSHCCPVSPAESGAIHFEPNCDESDPARLQPTISTGNQLERASLCCTLFQLECASTNVASRSVPDISAKHSPSWNCAKLGPASGYMRRVPVVKIACSASHLDNYCQNVIKLICTV